jgi:hypothetical protein
LLVCNAIPHLAAGLWGEAFPTPFARPRGGGRSSPVVNAIWGWTNLFIGLGILPRLAMLSALPPLHNSLFLCFAVGFLLCGLFLAWHFGKMRGG